MRDIYISVSYNYTGKRLYLIISLRDNNCIQNLYAKKKILPINRNTSTATTDSNNRCRSDNNKSVVI